jgi:hypothetical protein
MHCCVCVSLHLLVCPSCARARPSLCCSTIVACFLAWPGACLISHAWCRLPTRKERGREMCSAMHVKHCVYVQYQGLRYLYACFCLCRGCLQARSVSLPSAAHFCLHGACGKAGLVVRVAPACAAFFLCRLQGGLHDHFILPSLQLCIGQGLLCIRGSEKRDHQQQYVRALVLSA